MKNTRDIYQKLREVKYHYLIKLYKKLLKKIPLNCKYNSAYTINPGTKTSTTIRLCLLHQPETDMNLGVFPHLLDICQEPEHCINCNAFILKNTKESIKQALEDELKDSKIKAEKYPDICAMEWVLGKLVDDKPVGFFSRIKMALKDLFL